MAPGLRPEVLLPPRPTHCLTCLLPPLPLPRLENTPHPRGCLRSAPEPAPVLPKFLQESKEIHISPPCSPPSPVFFSNRIRKEVFLGTFTAWGSSHHFAVTMVFECGARCVHARVFPQFFRYYCLTGLYTHSHTPKLGFMFFTLL